MAPGQHAFTAMTFNVRYDEESDGAHQWTNRRDAVVDTIRAHAPDLLGLQEPTCDQWDQIALALPDMTALDSGFCRSSRFDLLGRGVFAISEAGARTCSWARLSYRCRGRGLG